MPIHQNQRCVIGCWTVAAHINGGPKIELAAGGISDIQAKAILELRLQRLTGMEREKIKEEFEHLMQIIKSLNDLDLKD